MAAPKTELDLETGLQHGTPAIASAQTVVKEGLPTFQFQSETEKFPRVLLLPDSTDSTPNTSATSSPLVSRNPSQDGGPRKPLPLPPKQGSRLTRYLFSEHASRLKERERA